MRVVVVYESVYGNTREVAEAVGEGLAAHHDVRVVGVDHVDGDVLDGVELLVVGGPTHAHGMTTHQSRELAAHDEKHPVEPATDPDAGLRTWLHHVRSSEHTWAAAFDTSADIRPLLAGSAAKGIARRLRHHGFRLVAEPERFLVVDVDGPLVDGELGRARAWGRDVGEAASAGLEVDHASWTDEP